MFQRIALILATILGLSFPVAGQTAAGETNGVLKGFVLDMGTGSTLHGVVLEILPGPQTVETDLDGLFSIELPPGQYQLTARKPGYRSWNLGQFAIKAGQETWQEIPLSPESGVLQETVEVVATTEKATVQAILSERKSLATLSDGIGRQEMSLVPGGDGAEVMQRVTGVSIVDNKYVFVRGLGERYSATQLNGSQIPSTQPDKKVIAMDLFPASLLENIQTEKSYTPDQPGEFAGGVVKVNTLDFPRQKTFKLTYGTSLNSLTTFGPLQESVSGKYDFWGFDDGSRSLPSSIPPQKVVRKTIFSPGYTRPELQEFGRSFANDWSFRDSRKAIPGQKFNIVAGNSWGPLGIVLAVNHGTDFETREEHQTYYKIGADGVLDPFNDYSFKIGSTKARTSGTANVAYRLSKDHKILFRNFYTHDGADEARYFDGFNADIGAPLRNYRLRFSEESIYSGQLGGEHYLGFLGNSLFEWTLTRANSRMDEPDLRETLYEYRPAQDAFVLANESQSGFRQFMNLREKIWDPDVRLTTFFQSGGWVGSFKFGTAYRDRNRDFESRRFRFIPVSTKGIDLTQSPENIFTSANIRPDGFELREETRNTDAYTAKQITRSYYAMADMALGRWRFVGGARYEDDMQRVSTFEPFTPDKVTVGTELANADVLPALNVIYQLNTQMSLRASASKTLNRPEFRELAPFDFTDVVGGRSVQGYAGLRRATIQNYDVRWEWYPGPVDLISASFFYKRFKDPIERIVEATAQLRTSFRNAEKADNYGFEVDFRRSLGFLSPGLEDFSLNANYTFVDSQVTIPDEGIIIQTNLIRPLAGQSRHVFNGIFEYTHPRWGTVARLLGNFQGQRISDVGALGLPDIIEAGYTRLDAIALQPLGADRKWGLKIAAENLLDEEVRFLQGGLPQRYFKTGRTLSISISYSFFDE